MAETVTRKYRGVKTTFEILTRAEAAERNLVVRPWRECRQGEWGLSDDDYVAECLQRLEYTNGKRTRALITFPYARVWTAKKDPLLFLERKATGKFGDHTLKSWQEKELTKSRAKQAVALYAAMILTGKVDWTTLGQAYRPDQAIPEATVRRLFRDEKIKAAVVKELERILAEKNVTQESVLQIYLDAIQTASNEGDASSMIKGADRLASLVSLPVGKPSGGQMPMLPDAEIERVSAMLEQAKGNMLLGTETGNAGQTQEPTDLRATVSVES